MPPFIIDEVILPLEIEIGTMACTFHLGIGGILSFSVLNYFNVLSSNEIDVPSMCALWLLR